MVTVDELIPVCKAQISLHTSPSSSLSVQLQNSFMWKVKLVIGGKRLKTRRSFDKQSQSGDKQKRGS